MPARLARGTRVGDRYRLDHELGRSELGVTWQATDERLDRDVALRIFDPGIDRKTLVGRAGVAASLTHPRVVRVFDTGNDEGRFFTVSELLPTSLRTVKLPLSAENALFTAIDIAEALQYAHERGVVHGNLSEGNVLLSESGAKVGDFGLSAESERFERPDDLRELGALIRRVIDRTTAPDGLVLIADRLAAGSYSSATDALGDLRSLRPAPAVPKARPSGRRIWPVFVVAILIAVAAIGATRLGKRDPGPHFAPGGKIDGTPIRPVSFVDYDPPPGDGREGHLTVSKLVDGQPGTFWSTEKYISSPDFSGRKKGVGVLFDMGKAIDIGKAQVLFSHVPCGFEIRSSDDRAAPVEEWPVAQSVPLTEAKVSSPIVFPSATARYWLLWITRLNKGVPGAGNAWACAVAEVSLYAP
jgi:serine/threonine protein kinase